MSSARPETVKSASRVLAILECFDEEKRPLTIAELVARLDIPQSSTSALMKSLLKLGYVSYDSGSRTFVPTLRVSLMGGWIEESFLGLGSIKHMMTELRDSTGDTVILGTQNDIFVQYIHIVESNRPVRFHLRKGLLRPLCVATVGRALLSLKRDDEIARIVRRVNAEADEGAPLVDDGELLRDIAAIRRRGYAFSVNRVTTGAGVVAMLLPMRPFQRPLAIGVGGPSARLEQNMASLVEELRAAVARYFSDRAGRAAISA